MADSFELESIWDPGFDGNSQVVVEQLGPWQRVYAKPANYRQRFFHTVYDLPLQEWSIAVPPRNLAGVCQVNTDLLVRFQPSPAYLARNLDCLPDPYAHIRRLFEIVILDQTEQALKDLGEGQWLTQGVAAVESAVETAVNVTLAANEILARSRCRIDFEFSAEGELETRKTIIKDAGFYDHYRQLLKQRVEQDQADLQAHLDALEEKQRQQLAHRERELALQREAEVLEQQAGQASLAELHAQLSLEEAQQRLRLDSAARRHQEQLRHEAELQQQQRDSQLEGMRQHLDDLTERENRTRREMDVLFMEKQRLLLEQEIDELRQRSRNARA